MDKSLKYAVPFDLPFPRTWLGLLRYIWRERRMPYRVAVVLEIQHSELGPRVGSIKVVRVDRCGIPREDQELM